MGSTAITLALVVALAAAGLPWHECLLLVTAALAAQRLELLRMQRAAPLVPANRLKTSAAMTSKART